MKNIARLGDFEPADAQRSALLLVWQAREYLSDAEHKEDTLLSLRRHWCIDAATLLEAARTLINRDISISLPNIHRQIRIAELLERAVAAARAAVENARIAEKYFASSNRPNTTDWDRQRTPRVISIFKRAAETGRQETHRALVELCELFPNVMPSEE